MTTLLLHSVMLMSTLHAVQHWLEQSALQIE